ncbi:hypothetical protein [Mucilaginibacter sp. dw_454]|uniref:hypothetical protein n=1 Tax=Mucilaginibacter sp. dw_454 TaxID=2720079 RepID=UPI001BD4E536|nr:hypothetical protein [Mucilaginibacter sp. dw_454]
MKNEIIIVADYSNRMVDFKVSDLISYVDSGVNTTNIWVKDESLERKKRFYKLSISITGFESILYSKCN